LEGLKRYRLWVLKKYVQQNTLWAARLLPRVFFSHFRLSGGLHNRCCGLAEEPH